MAAILLKLYPRVENKNMKNWKLIFGSLIVFILLEGCSLGGYKSLNTEVLSPRWIYDDEGGYYRSRLFSKAFFHYAVLSADVYDKDETEYERIKLPNIWSELIVEGGIEESIGFAAKAWIFNEDEIVVVFRGTDSSIDWPLGNLVITPFQTYRNQFDAALDFARNSIRKAAKYNIKKVTFTGHSLGGGLAEYVQKHYPNSKAVTFNQSPNTGYLYSFPEQKNDPSVIRFYEKNELASFFNLPFTRFDKYSKYPWEYKEGNIWMNFYRDGSYDGHDMLDFAMAITKVAAISGSSDAEFILKNSKDYRGRYDLDGSEMVACQASFDLWSLRKQEKREASRLPRMNKKLNISPFSFHDWNPDNKRCLRASKTTKKHLEE